MPKAYFHYACDHGLCECDDKAGEPTRALEAVNHHMTLITPCWLLLLLALCIVSFTKGRSNKKTQVAGGHAASPTAASTTSAFRLAGGTACIDAVPSKA
eukprot:5785529-Amphidinium_carterae.2